MISPWILALRLKTLPAGIAPIVMGSALAFINGQFHLLTATLTLLTSLLIQIGTNFANDYYDFIKGSDTEDRLGPKRMTQSGNITPKSMKNAFMLLFGLSILSGIYLIFRGGIPILTIGIISIISGILYTGGPKPLGYMGLGDLFVLIFFGPIALGGTYYLQTLSITPSIILIGLIPGLIATAILVINNLRDIPTDTLSNKRTLAVRFGKLFSQIQYTICLSISVYLLWYFDAPITSLICSLFSILLIKACIKKTGKELNIVLENTGKLLIVVSILSSLEWIF